MKLVNLYRPFVIIKCCGYTIMYMHKCTSVNQIDAITVKIMPRYSPVSLSRWLSESPWCLLLRFRSSSRVNVSRTRVEPWYTVLMHANGGTRCVTICFSSKINLTPVYVAASLSRIWWRMTFDPFIPRTLSVDTVRDTARGVRLVMRD